MLGQGAYRLSDVARYARLPASTVRAWFKERSDSAGRGPIFRADYDPVDDDYAVSFLDLVDAYVARFFRQEGVSPGIIRKARENLQVELSTKHPFAHAELCTDGVRIIRKAAGAVRSTEFTDVISRQGWFSQMAKHLKRIVYAGDTKLAVKWNIATGVVIDPCRAYGKPSTESSGIATFVLANQVNANDGSAEVVADLFDISECDVVNAVNFELKYGLRLRVA